MTGFTYSSSLDSLFFALAIITSPIILLGGIFLIVFFFFGLILSFFKDKKNVWSQGKKLILIISTTLAILSLFYTLPWLLKPGSAVLALATPLMFLLPFIMGVAGLWLGVIFREIINKIMNIQH